MRRRINPTLAATLFVILFVVPASATTGEATSGERSHFFSPSTALVLDNDRDRDGLAGPVRRVRTETVKLSNKGGKTVEGERAVMETVAYDIKGSKTENAYFPVPGATLTGKEVYKYDAKGNIVEMTLLNADGTLLSKEVYSYELDNFGNWTKMTTSVAVIEGGKLSYEPTEVTYRMISYYLDEATLARLNPPAATQHSTPVPAAIVPASISEQTSKPASTMAQPLGVAANKGVTPMPSGVSLIKTGISASDSGLGSLGSVTGGSSVKIEDEPPPVAISTPKPLLRPVSGGVLNGKAVLLPKPTYPTAARNARASGIVTVEVVIDEYGKVISARRFPVT